MLEYLNVKDDIILHKCFCCNSNYQEKFHRDLKMCFLHTYEFSNYDINKLLSLL